MSVTSLGEALRYELVKDHSAKLWSRVRPSDGCMVFVGGSASSTPYARLNIRDAAGKTYLPYVHRMSWVLHTHADLLSSEWLLHRCDTPRCVDPQHLTVGDHSANMQDKLAKGRQARGTHHGHARLDEDQVRHARALLADGHSLAYVGRQLGVSKNAIHHINRGTTWGWLA